MSYKLGGQIIKNEFELFCILNNVDGALKVELSKIYHQTGSVDELDVRLIELGDNHRIQEDKEHLISNSKMEKAIINSRDSTTEEVRIAKRNRLSIAEAIFHPHGRERHQGD